ncbi:MAG TPA: hypothetical protein VM009_05790 [Terriglobales bacterium]|nr:hypothetical protein [Terriglobales bacterium]
MSAVNVLSTQLRERKRTTPESQAQRTFLDFCVDGRSLYDLLNRDCVSGVADKQPASISVEFLERLKLATEADFPNNRRSLYVCAECGDLGCGAVSIAVAAKDGVVVWEDFGYENKYEDEVIREGYEFIGPFRFNADAYAAVLEEAEKEASQLAAPVEKVQLNPLLSAVKRIFR